jgi:hypothetical protein
MCYTSSFALAIECIDALGNLNSIGGCATASLWLQVPVCGSCFPLSADTYDLASSRLKCGGQHLHLVLLAMCPTLCMR